MQISFNRLGWIAALAILCVWLSREACNVANKNNLIGQIESYTDSTRHFKIALNKLDSIDVATNEVLVLENDNQAKALLARGDSMKKILANFRALQAIVKTKSTTSIGDFGITFDSEPGTTKLDPIPCDFKPFEVDSINDHFAFKSVVSETQLKIKYIGFTDQESVVIGDKRKGLFGRQTTIDVTHSNPYVDTQKIQGYVVHEQKWWQNRWLYFGAGVVSMGLAEHYLTR